MGYFLLDPVSPQCRSHFVLRMPHISWSIVVAYKWCFTSDCNITHTSYCIAAILYQLNPLYVSLNDMNCVCTFKNRCRVCHIHVLTNFRIVYLYCLAPTLCCNNLSVLIWCWLLNLLKLITNINCIVYELSQWQYNTSTEIFPYSTRKTHCRER